MHTSAIDLNCDMGESFGRYTLGRDEEVIRYITSANIACGYHAGDPQAQCPSPSPPTTSGSRTSSAS